MTGAGIMVAVGTASAVLWLVILVLPWRPWRVAESLEGTGRGDSGALLDDLDVLIPARNEAATIGACLRGVRAQGRGVRILVVDDQSDDGTREVACSLNLPDVRIIRGRPAPPEWSGKVWALQQGLAHARRPYVLLLDADIRLVPGVVAEMKRRMENEGLDLVSVMAELSMRSFWERLLIPAFVYFFKLLYPFRLSNSRFPRVAAAAGGCMLIRRDALARASAFVSIRNTLIDDCALAARIKHAGGRTWIGLSRSVVSMRVHDGLESIWHTVTRTAFAQLRYSVAWLTVCTLLMALAFVGPPAALLVGGPAARASGGVALVTMALTYWPLIRYYGLAPGWALTLPAAGALYLAMTWVSAMRYWRGVRSVWKGRVYYSASGDNWARFLDGSATDGTSDTGTVVRGGGADECHGNRRR